MKHVLYASLFAAVLVGCGDTGDVAVRFEPFTEIYEAGLTKYVDEFDPRNEPEPNGQGTKQFEFDSDNGGPICLRGSEFLVNTREGSSDNLLIYLQGGGACFTEICAAFETAIPYVPLGILDTEDPTNPFFGWDVVYVPYCDGSIFAGDVDRFVGGEMGYQRGLINLTAALDIAIEEFPAPGRVALAGVSAGGFGTITATPLTRYYYPEGELIVLNDSGLGVLRDGDPDFVNGILDEFNVTFIPESCSDCTSDGHITELIAWELTQDENLFIAAYSHETDSVIRGFTGLSEEAFEEAMLEETRQLTEAFPSRYKRFILTSSDHTVLLGGLDKTADGVTVRQWTQAFVDGDGAWVNTIDPAVLE